MILFSESSLFQDRSCRNLIVQGDLYCSSFSGSFKTGQELIIHEAFTVPLPAVLSLHILSRQVREFVVSVVSVTVTMAAIMMLCMETMPAFSGPRCGGYTSVDPFFVGETVCTAWFTMEFLARLASSPSKRSFFLDFKNMVDFIAVIPYYVSMLLDSDGAETETVPRCDSMQNGGAVALETSPSLTYLRAIRLVRVVRILKLTKYCLGLQVTQFISSVCIIDVKRFMRFLFLSRFYVC